MALASFLLADQPQYKSAYVFGCPNVGGAEFLAGFEKLMMGTLRLQAGPHCAQLSH